MNTQNTDPSAQRARRKAVFAALLVALFGLTVAPGFSCKRTEPDGTVTEVNVE